ncbi:MAG: Gfo/Idh/MocA family oxidoreductase [Planctomycetes bacterium]|nr:Gfo/Idh/MocA family oxidoreductase [Planctomycetota bacterium]
MIRVGIAGIGFMGWIHYLAYQRVRGIRLTAICTRDPSKLAGDWTSIQGNFGPRGEQVDLRKIGAYSDVDALIADPELDLIDICLPPDLHLDVTLRALAAGKHVLVEKPMALTARDCDRMVAAADKAGKQVFCGQVLPFFPEYSEARKIVAGGKYGRMIGGNFKRIISDPLWLKDFYDPAKVGGPLVDLHVHDAHLIRLLCGMPASVVSQGRMRGEVVEYCNTHFHFADRSLVVSATSGVIRQQSRSFTHGFEIHLEKATLQYELAVAGGSGKVLMPLTVFDHKGQTLTPTLPAGDDITAFAAEISEVVRALKSGKPSETLSGALARDAITLCHRQTQSVKSGKLVKI